MLRTVEAEHLLDDLARVQVAGEAELTRYAEHATHGAAGLRGDADGLPGSLLLRRGGVHLNRLDLLAVVEAKQQFGREPVG